MGDDPADERALAGGWHQRNLVERGGVVFRQAGPQTAAVLRLLRHLEAVGFPAAPRVVEPGISDDGREMVTFVEGDVVEQPAWSEEALGVLGALVRQLHDATRTMASQRAHWRRTFFRSLPMDEPVIGHGDLGPWNVVSRNGLPVAFIDWDTAGPVGALWDLAYVAWLNVQLHDDDIARHHGLPDAATRGQHLRVLLDGYGLPPKERSGFVRRIAEVAVHEAKDEAVQAGVTRESTAGVLDDGYPILWAVTWRARSASWILANREILTAAIV